jgi:hypothetical protein
MVATLLLAFAIHPVEALDRETVDLIEVNFWYDKDTGNPYFQQIIFYDWDDEAERYQCRGWRQLHQRSQLPVKDWATGMYYVYLSVHDNFVRINARAIRESSTLYDPENYEKTFLPLSRRKPVPSLPEKKRSPRIYQR